VSEGSAQSKHISREVATSSFADLLKCKRVSAGYSIEDMAVVTGLTATEIADAEKGNKASSSTLARLKGALHKLR
jgi:transcriptional regulator with XRE-family HTH domain